MVGSTSMSRFEHLARFYDILSRLADRCGGPVPMSALDPRHLPRRGVYFFFEPGENRSDSGTGPRVVRVGTHGLKAGSKSTLSQRLRQHRGTNAGTGNHRGSIFRLLLGQALMASGTLPQCETWGIKGDAKRAAVAAGVSVDHLKEAERSVERAVSKSLGAMSVLWVEVPDEPGPESVRGVIERNSIALLSNHHGQALDPASDAWLGLRSNRSPVHTSGLWNQNHITETYDPRYFDAFSELVDAR